MDSKYETLNKYFDILSKFGYMKYSEVYKLLLYLFIYDDIFEGYLSSYISDTDAYILYDMLECLGGSSCLIPSFYPVGEIQQPTL